MAEFRKVLGQSAPSAGTLTAGYTVPGATTAIVSTLVACNAGAAADFIRVSVAVAGAADEAKQYIVYDAELAPYESRTLTLGITLGATDVVRVYSQCGTTVFNLFGVEVT